VVTLLEQRPRGFLPRRSGPRIPDVADLLLEERVEDWGVVGKRSTSTSCAANATAIVALTRLRWCTGWRGIETRRVHVTISVSGAHASKNTVWSIAYARALTVGPLRAPAAASRAASVHGISTVAAIVPALRSASSVSDRSESEEVEVDTEAEIGASPHPTSSRPPTAKTHARLLVVIMSARADAADRPA
jgi:hypothetical protein